MMLLLDSHVALWVLGDAKRISRAAAQRIERSRKSGSALGIAGITLFELAGLVVRQRIEVDVSLDLFLREIESRFVVLHLSGAIAEKAARLPSSFPNDPSDRIIAATAIVEGLPLVTADERIQDSGVVETIW